MRPTFALVLLCATLLSAGAPAAAAPDPTPSRADAIRAKLLRLPYYGVFDFLAFSETGGTVTLSGYVFHAPLRADAERAVRQVPGVTAVTNTIEILPVSTNDDSIRWRTYDAIYSDPFLARYAPGGGILWGHRHLVPMGPFGSARRLPGMEPVGIYPIAIIVKNGHVTLMGVVDSEMDRTMAGMKAGGVPGTFGVDNELTVEHGT